MLLRLRLWLTQYLEYAPHALLFVRISPDMTLEEIEDVANVIMETGTDGMIVTNTTNARSS